ncbi:MAG: hypothetical protein FJ137_05175 [Deltaproteobacteria bacterium]|nr:hypothetical protein [Deltaproteobacteria bacterium]
MSFRADRRLAGCDEGSCPAEIVEALGVDLLVLGQLERLGAERVFVVRVLDQREGRAVAIVSRRLVLADGEEVLAMVGPTVAEIFPAVLLRPGVSAGASITGWRCG